MTGCGKTCPIHGIKKICHMKRGLKCRLLAAYDNIHAVALALVLQSSIHPSTWHFPSVSIQNFDAISPSDRLVPGFGIFFWQIQHPFFQLISNCFKHETACIAMLGSIYHCNFCTRHAPKTKSQTIATH